VMAARLKIGVGFLPRSRLRFVSVLRSGLIGFRPARSFYAWLIRGVC
jgi:hypothetical protein